MINSYHQQRLNMLDSQIKPFSVVNDRILKAFESVAREEYIPAERRSLAYLGGDFPVALEGAQKGRFMLDPANHARLLQSLNIDADQSVLDIGCLTGYSTAILSQLTNNVIGLDQVEWVAQAKNLAHQSLEFVAGELTAGLPLQEEAFDVIVINGAIQHIPEPLIAQLKENGMIATFWRGVRNQGHAVLYRKHDGNLHEQILFDAFVPVLPGFESHEGFIF